MGYPSRGIEGNNVEGNVGCAGPAQEVSVVKNVRMAYRQSPKLDFGATMSFCLTPVLGKETCIESPPEKGLTHNSKLSTLEISFFVHHYNKGTGNSGLKEEGLLPAHSLSGYSLSWQKM